MSSVSTSTSSFRSILNAALDDYSKQTGIDLTNHSSVEQFQNCHAPDDVIRLLLQREKDFKDYRAKYRKLINFLRPVVQVVHGFSNVLGDAAGLVPFQPTKLIVTGIDVLLAAAIGVTQSYDALNDLFESLANFLKRFHFYTEKIPSSPMMSDIMATIMAQVINVLALATKQIKQGRFMKFTKKLLGENEVETVLRRLDRLTQEEARMTVTHTLEVVHGLFNNLKEAMNDGKASMDGVQQALVKIQETADGIHNIERMRLQKDVRAWLLPPDPSLNHNIARRDHYERTGSWFIQSDRFKEWMATGSLLWIHGKPGSGKSILCSSIIQEVKRLRDTGLALITYFYCDFRDSKKQEVAGLLASLVAQLSAKSDPCHDILSALYSEFDGGSQRPDDDTLRGCLEEMLKTEGQPTIYIIIDGLDECPNHSGVKSPRDRVIELVEQLVDLSLGNVRICATSRPEADIQAVLMTLTSHTVSLHDEDGQKKDIADYVRSVVYSDRKMRRWRVEDKEMVIRTLSRRADGMFRYITCQLEALKHTLPSAIRRAVDNLPDSLDETYDRILKSIPRGAEEYAQYLFQCVAVSIRPLRVEELADILTIRFDTETLPHYDTEWRPENPEEEVLSVCSSLITVVNMDGSRVVRFSHFSVQEYLTSERLSKAEERLSHYYIFPESAHAILTTASLSVLLTLDCQVDKHSMKDFPFAIYAARYWVNHVLLCDVSSGVKGAMRRLFDPDRPQFATWVWLHDVDRSFLGTMLTARPSPPEAVPLYYAALLGFPSLVEHLLLTHPGDINAKGGCYCTPLHAAVARGNVDIVELLLNHGGDVAALDNDGWNLLCVASSRGHLDVICSLLDHRLDVNSPSPMGWTPLMKASERGELEVARVLLRHGASVDSRAKDGWNSLLWASYNGHLQVVHLLLQNGTTVDSSNANGSTSLMKASQHGHLEVVRLLLQNSATVDSRNNKGSTSLMLASQNGHLQVVHLLLQNRATVDSRNNNGSTPLMLASKSGHLEVVRLLLQNGAAQGSHPIKNRSSSNDSNISNQSFSSPLHLASTKGHPAVVELLIQSGADVNSRNQHQETPLHQASSHGQLNIAEMLLMSGSNVHLRDGEGSTPLHKAAQRGHLQVVTLLVKFSADVNIRNSNNALPLDLAYRNGKHDVAKFLAECMGVKVQDHTHVTCSDPASQDPLFKVSQSSIGREQGATRSDKGISLLTASEVGDIENVRLLLDGGADVNERDKNHMTPILYACKKGRLEVARLLIDCGADVKSCDKTGWAPLLLASRYGHRDIVQLLLDHGANVNAKRHDHWTALHLASIGGYFEVVEMLLKHGANVGARNDEGRTPSQVASRSGYRDIVRLLAEYDHDVDET